MSRITIDVELRPFIVPNYVSAMAKPRPREQGVVESPSYALSELDEKTLSALCDEFRATVFEKAGKDDPRL